MLNIYESIASLAPLIQAACLTKSKYDMQSKAKEPFSAYIVNRNGVSLSVSSFVVVTFHLRGLKQGKLTLYHMSPSHSSCFFFYSNICFVFFTACRMIRSRRRQFVRKLTRSCFA